MRALAPAGVVLALVALLCGPLVAGVEAEKNGKHAAALNQADWRRDLQYFAAELPKRHKNLFHSVSRAEFDRAVAELDAAIPSLEDHQIAVGMMRIAASVGDGHTGVHVPKEFKRYPLILYWFERDLRVIAVPAGNAPQSHLGARLVAIGGLDIAEVQARVRGCFPSAENENEWYVMSTSPSFIVRPEILHALKVVPDLGAATFTFEDDQGKRFDVELVPIAGEGGASRQWTRPSASEPLSRQRPGERFWFTDLPESQTVYVSFRGYESLGENARKLFEFLDANPTRRVVIDLRQNGGGDFFEGRRHLIRPLQDRPAINQQGRLFVLVGRQTFSAAMVNAIDFRKETNATLVGEPIGERPNSYSENDEMTLPNSRLVVSYSTRYYEFLEQDVPAVLPDQRIDPSWDVYKSGGDPVMDWILSDASR
ncbi:MAG TPA: S41 family peptidase [Thermoanaerobaculia bacterium]|nr:S41 family peptidase [Thermoanaerobaculia bacterium]